MRVSVRSSCVPYAATIVPLASRPVVVLLDILSNCQRPFVPVPEPVVTRSR